MGEMASAVAHGIRNPLASIRSSAELALADDPENARQFASDIVAEADRMDKWVRDLLLYARSDGPDLEAVDINEVVRESLRGFGPAMERQNVAVTVDAERCRRRAATARSWARSSTASSPTPWKRCRAAAD